MSTSVTKKRLLPGSSAQSAFNYDLESIKQSEGHFAAQELIQQLIRKNPRDIPTICALPPNQDKFVWLIEHLRQFLLELNAFCACLESVCNQNTCPKMTATKDEYLCAAHPQPKECCAIDYIVHQINGFAALLNSNEFFPNRVNIQAKSIQLAQSITRRLYRVFAHAYFRHADAFWEFETRSLLCSRFKHFVVMTKLMTPDQFIIQPRELQQQLQTKLAALDSSRSGSSESASSTSSQ